MGRRWRRGLHPAGYIQRRPGAASLRLRRRALASGRTRPPGHRRDDGAGVSGIDVAADVAASARADARGVLGSGDRARLVILTGGHAYATGLVIGYTAWPVCDHDANQAVQHSVRHSPPLVV